MKKALRRGGDTHTLEDIVEAVKKGEMQAFFNDRAIIVTEIAVTPRKRFLSVMLTAGVLDGVLALLPEVEAWAATQGVHHAKVAVRPGYEKILKARGWTRSQVLMEYRTNGR